MTELWPVTQYAQRAADESTERLATLYQPYRTPSPYRSDILRHANELAELFGLGGRAAQAHGGRDDA